MYLYSNLIELYTRVTIRWDTLNRCVDIHKLSN